LYDWKKILLNESDSMVQAINVLDQEALRIALVVDESCRLLGTITDGDIRRALVRHIGMESSVVDVMRKNPTIVSVAEDRNSILALMKRRGLLQIPILDSENRVVGLETMEQLVDVSKHDNIIFLMAGGFGKRLRPLTDDVPKPLLKIGSKPILETIVEQFVDSGFSKFYISTHHKAELVRNHFGDGSKWGVNIQYIYEDEPLGTAGALGLLSEAVNGLPIIVMNGDLLTKVNVEHLLEFHKELGGVATMCVREYDFQVPYGVVQSDGHNMKGIIEKPVHNYFINAGIYVLEPEIILSIDGKSYLDMPCLFERSIKSGEQINVFPIHEYWLDIGRMEEFEKANRDIVE